MKARKTKCLYCPRFVSKTHIAKHIKNKHSEHYVPKINITKRIKKMTTKKNKARIACHALSKKVIFNL
jgi:hypothetical protein